MIAKSQHTVVPTLSAAPRLRWPKLHHYEISIVGLDPRHDGLRLAHLTDLHVGLVTPLKRIRAAIELTNQWAPDLTLLTGDYVCYSPKHVPRMQDALAGLQGQVFATLGNHDYWTDSEGVERGLIANGYQVLRNTHHTLHLRGAPLHIIGIDDAHTNHHDIPLAFSAVPRQGTRLVL